MAPQARYGSDLSARSSSWYQCRYFACSASVLSEILLQSRPLITRDYFTWPLPPLAYGIMMPSVCRAELIRQDPRFTAVLRRLWTNHSHSLQYSPKAAGLSHRSANTRQPNQKSFLGTNDYSFLATIHNGKKVGIIILTDRGLPVVHGRA
jgi:hypothetical protein